LQWLRRLRDAGVGDEDVQSIADDGAYARGQSVRSIWRPQIGGDLLGGRRPSLSRQIRDLEYEAKSPLMRERLVDDRLVGGKARLGFPESGHRRPAFA
jgi:hypothetical protein